MDKVTIRNIIVLSLLVGSILGLLAVIPHIGLLAMLVSVLISAPIVMVYLIMDGKFDLTTIKDSIITGALIGAISGVAFSVVYSILIALLSVVFHYSSNLVLSYIITKSYAWIYLSMIIFIGVLYAFMNAFSGFLTYYIINFMRDVYEQNHPNNNRE